MNYDLCESDCVNGVTVSGCRFCYVGFSSKIYNTTYLDDGTEAWENIRTEEETNLFMLKNDQEGNIDSQTGNINDRSTSTQNCKDNIFAHTALSNPSNISMLMEFSKYS